MSWLFSIPLRTVNNTKTQENVSVLIRARFSLANNADNVFVPFVVFLAVVMGGQGRSEDYAFGGCTTQFSRQNGRGSY